MSWLGRNWFLAGLGAVVVAGGALPEAADRLRASAVALPLLTAASLFISGVALETSAVRGGVETRGVAAGLFSIFVAAPLLAWALAWLFGPPFAAGVRDRDQFFEAMMIVAAQAGTIASAPALTLVAGGDQSLALSITISSNLLTAFVTPTILRITLGAVVSLPLGRMIASDALVVLAPVAAGLGARRLLRRGIRRLLPALVKISQSIILVFVYTGVATAATHLTGRASLIVGFVATAACLHLLLVAWNFQVSGWLRLSAASRAAVAICGSQKTLPNGIYLWDRFFPSNPHGALALVCYHVFQLVFDSLLVPWLRAEPPVGTPAEELIDGA